MKVSIFIATTGDGLARASKGAEGRWMVEHLLSGEDVRCLAADPLRPNVVYAGTQGDGVWRSDDCGKSWGQVGLEGAIVKSLVASPIEQGTIYAGTKPPMVFVSRDGGAIWRELQGFRRIPWRWAWRSPAEKPYTAYVQAIALSPTDPNSILAGIEAGAVVRSEDGGKSWSRHRPGALRDCHTLIFHHADGNYAYEGGGTGGGVAISRDAGRSWQKVGASLDRHYGWAVAADPDQPSIWYTSVAPGPSKAHVDGRAEAYIFRKRGSEPWRKLAGGLPQPLTSMPYALLTDPTAPGHLYAGLSNGDVWYSKDYGDGWERLPVNVRAIHQSMLLL